MSRLVAPLLVAVVVLAACGGVGTTIPRQGGGQSDGPTPTCGSLDPPTCGEAVAVATQAIGPHGPLAAIAADATCPPNARCITNDLIVAFLAVDGSTMAVTLDWRGDGSPGAVMFVDRGPDAGIPAHVEEQLRR
jgi:hypothetical protein